MRLQETLALPCGLVLKNRIAKAAMTEQLCRAGAPHGAYTKLYRAFADGGAALTLSGNIMVQRTQREHPRNVIVDVESPLDAFARVADVCRGKTALVAQLSHPGRQAMYAKPQPLAPSAIALQGLGPVFKAPRALTVDEIEQIIEAFAFAAHFVQRAGWDGAQIHGAHGYLASQFLSPLANQRTDEWGGSLENRARFLLRVVDAIRARTSAAGNGGRANGAGGGTPAPPAAQFAVMVKLNSADFQKGGFDADDAIAVMQMLDGKIDLLEISGGSYEAPAMVGMMRDSTRKREAYFLEFAERARQATRTPLMVTGGFRTKTGMEEALASGAIDVVGMARPLAIDPALPHKMLSGAAEEAVLGNDRTGLRMIDSLLASQFYVENLHRIAAGKEADPKLSRLWAIAHATWMSQGL